jgi:hypothetical protein
MRPVVAGHHWQDLPGHVTCMAHKHIVSEGFREAFTCTCEEDAGIAKSLHIFHQLLRAPVKVYLNSCNNAGIILRMMRVTSGRTRRFTERN